MKIQDARKLKIGYSVMTPGGFSIKICSINENTSWTTGKPTIYISGKTDTGSVIKFSHKEVKMI